MLTLIHKECGGPALDESPVGEVCAIPVDRFLFSCLPARATNRTHRNRRASPSPFCLFSSLHIPCQAI